MRIIVTGSRALPDRGPVWAALNLAKTQYGSFILAHGGCATGADAYASQWAQAHPEIAEQVYRADWKALGSNAGPVRNRRMVADGADLVLAFPLPQGSRTQHTIRLAREAGIRVETWRPTDGPR